MTRLCDIYKISNQEVAFKIIENRYSSNVDKQNKIKKTWMNKNDNTIDYINRRIKNEICYDTINQLKDDHLMSDYKNCLSVQNQIKKLQNILQKNKVDTCKISNIINDYILELIPPRTKGVIRGNKFNQIIKNHILSL
jgi:translation initiation factor 2 beta subunit (eIF-2beta)/eIF-5